MYYSNTKSLRLNLVRKIFRLSHAPSLGQVAKIEDTLMNDFSFSIEIRSLSNVHTMVDEHLRHAS